QLTMAQQVPLSGAVIVSTPQDIALLDARKGLNMFRKVDVPVLGIVENMSYFLCPHCGERSNIFSHGGARREADKLGMEFLGEIPLDMAIRETSDGGNPIVVSQPTSPHAATYRAIAERIWQKVSGAPQKTAPRIVIEQSSSSAPFPQSSDRRLAGIHPCLAEKPTARPASPLFFLQIERDLELDPFAFAQPACRLGHFFAGAQGVCHGARG